MDGATLGSAKAFTKKEVQNIVDFFSKQTLINRLKSAALATETVTSVGDSITASYDFDEILVSRFKGAVLNDQGVPGDTVTKVYQRIADIKATNGKVYLVNIGINDIRYGMTTDVEYIAMIENIWNELKNIGDVYFISIWPTFSPDAVMDSTIANPLIDARNEALRKFCFDRNISFINATQTIRNYINTTELVAKYVPDGVHPSADGKPLYADAVQGLSLGLGSKIPYDTVSVYDSFDRADLGSLGNADTGQAWEVLSGTWGISANKAFKPSNGLDAYNVAVQAGLSNCSISAILGGSDLARARLAFRVTDQHNFLYVLANTDGTYKLYKVEGDALEVLGTANVMPVLDDEVEIILYNENIMLRVNGEFILSVTNTFNQNAVKHGLMSTTASGGTWDNFKILI